MQIAEALHDHQEIVFFCKQLMMLKVIDHLQAELVLNWRSMLLFLTLFQWLLAHCSLFTHAWVCMAQSGKLEAIADWIPLEVEHGMDRLDLYPPASLLESVPDQD